MIHKMKLQESPFERIKNGTKTVEFRLYDEKRSKIKIGDQIEFSKLPDLQETILVDVLDLYREDTFENLFKKLFTDEDEIKKKTKSMYQYYSPDEEKQYGVVGIKISLISSGFRYTYNKLVRDKIPENINSESGRKSKYRILNDKEYLNELNKKVIEEANEFIEENSIEELGDLMEVINAIMQFKNYKTEELYKVMKEKADKKGAFNNRIYLEYVDEEKRNLEEEKELNKEFRK
jgi:predicted house-cleaning noncanonical NTP pyrophosphatase (MazG superfamily)/ASC-1-like (ASCH) protein